MIFPLWFGLDFRQGLLCILHSPGLVLGFQVGTTMPSYGRKSVGAAGGGGYGCG